jgi:hypothetical protein
VSEIGQQMSDEFGRPGDNRNWRMFRGKRGYFRWYQRLYEAGLILLGKHSLHRAWQLGLDQGSQNEYQRLITNRAAHAELRHSRPFAPTPPTT